MGIGLRNQKAPDTMQSRAVIFEEPRRISLMLLDLVDPTETDVVVESLWSGISAGTEKLLYEGTMPAFPGMGYPLVPGYETVGRVVEVGGSDHRSLLGRLAFVPGARCYQKVSALFGASSSTLVTPADRIILIEEDMAETGTLLSLAATAYHALALAHLSPPDLVIGHGIVGRLVARILLAMGAPAPTVWEINPARRGGAQGYEVTTREACEGRKFRSILDASGDHDILDQAVAVIAPGGEITLAGFYGERMSFRFASAFMREVQIRIAAEFKPSDVAAVLSLVAAGKLSLDNLISHRAGVEQAEASYRTAFGDPDCLKMILEWRTQQ